MCDPISTRRFLAHKKRNELVNGELFATASTETVGKLPASRGKATPSPTTNPTSLNHTNFGAAILRPGGFVVLRISRHFQTEADRLNAIAIHPLRNEILAHCARAPVTQPTIIFRRPAFIRKAGDDYLRRAAFHELGNLLNFPRLRRTHRLTIEIEIDRLKLSALNIAAKKRRALAALRKRCPGNIITGRAGTLTATFVCATAASAQDRQE